jgi:hypothetical protein
MKLISKTLVFAVSASVFLTACSGGGNARNGLYYNNYTGADTEGYEFLKVVSEEANYQQIAAGRVGNPQLADEIKQTYATIAKEVHDLSDREKVLSPNLSSHYNLDSNERAKLIKSQEVIISQFKRVTHNTNVNIADYAKDNLPKLEQLLSETKSSK